jgi:hypothetical protein
MQIVNHSAAAQIEEIFAHAAIPSTSSLPLTNMYESMLNLYPFAQPGSSFWRLLALAQLDK